MTTIGPAVDGAPSLYSVAFDLSTVGYTAAEHFVTGRAVRFRDAVPRTPDGRWAVEPGDSAPFTTRIVVHRPASADTTNGSVVVEWLNVTGGLDIPAVWMAAHRHLVRSGFTWVGVSVQETGIRGGGGAMAGLSLRESAPERYATLAHPGDAYAFDLFSTVARSLRDALPELHGVPVERMLAVGASQSAMYLTTYVNAVDPDAAVFDGFLLQGRAGAGVPIAAWDPASIRFDPGEDPAKRRARLFGRDRIRGDVRVPVLVVQSETDVFGSLQYVGARQDDGARFRLWEVAGAAHCDTYFLNAAPHDNGRLPAAELADLLANTTPSTLTKPMNCGPQMHYVLQRALASLDHWVRKDEAPATAPRLDLLGDRALAIDEYGIATGGVRTPWVDAPVTVLSGLGQPGVLEELMGTSRPLTRDELASRWPGGRAQYTEAFRNSTADAVARGFLLGDDADEIAALGAHAWPAE
jgi:Alpha/beta hydrolase domain